MVGTCSWNFNRATTRRWEMRLTFVCLLLMTLTVCGPADHSSIPTRYYSYECAWCGFFQGSDQPFGCYTKDGTYHQQTELISDPNHWYHFSCCDAWWAGQYMCMNSGLCNDCLSFAADIPPQTAAGCSSEPWNEHWNAWCDAWDKACYQGNCQ